MLRTIASCATIAALSFGAARAQTAEPAGQQASQPPAPAGALALVSRADVHVGETVNDLTGQAVGVVKRVTADGAVISTGKNRAEVPFAGIRWSSNGLITSVTRAQIDEIKQASPSMPEEGPSMPAM